MQTRNFSLARPALFIIDQRKLSVMGVLKLSQLSYFIALQLWLKMSTLSLSLAVWVCMFLLYL